MSRFDLIFCFLVLVFSGGVCDSGSTDDLPSWIKNKPAFQDPKTKNSVETGFGSLSSKEKEETGWLVTLNEKEGHGIELEVEKLSINPDSDDFLLVSPWPMTGKFKRIKLYSGKFSEPLKPLRIPNTKAFFVLYSVSQTTADPEMALKYRRYGSPLELLPLPTEDPIKKKETIYEIQLKGKEPVEYTSGGFMAQVKEAIRAQAKRFCAAQNINFNDNIPTEKMVLIHKISFCPFEWPDSHICASLEHSVFVSGTRVPDQELILNYELTADKLKKMWSENDFPELQALGVTVFKLPPTGSTVAYWSLIIGLTALSSLIIALILRKAYRTRISQRKTSVESEEVAKIKTPKFKLHKHQTVPSFIYNQRDPNLIRLEGHLQKEIAEQNASSVKTVQASKFGQKPETSFGNYTASMLFGDNGAFEDEEDYKVEFRRKPPLTK